uniref:TWiK family of potassium channels protein 18 n=2 Tax=Cacopsylla melanoneura TaxID=428564 RepID=A0A8D8ZRU3_9HEMI
MPSREDVHGGSVGPAAADTISSRGGSSPSKCTKYVRKFFKHLFSNLGLFGLVVGYVFIGAVVFEYLESKNEIDQRIVIQAKRDECVKELWHITGEIILVNEAALDEEDYEKKERLNVLYEQNWTALVTEKLFRFEKDVIEMSNTMGYNGRDVADKDRQWSFSGALLYSVTVITTIGYGNLAPKTPIGKIVTMVYALFGIPLMLLCISNLGSLLADTFQFTYAHSCCAKRHKSDYKRSKKKSSSTTGGGGGHSPSHYSSGGGGGQGYTAISVDGLPPAPPPPQAMSVILERGNPVSHLTPEARHILTECAQYQLTQCRDLYAEDVLSQLSQEDESARGRYHSSRNGPLHCPPSPSPYSTPTKVPLLWKPPGDSSQRGGGGQGSSSTQHHQGEVGPSGSSGVKKRKQQRRVPISLVLTVLVGYICIGAGVFAAWEQWSFLDGAYFCFVTLSTIGFGDLVPGKSFQHTDTQDGQIQLVACCAYLLIGLVLIAMSFSLVQEEVLTKGRKLAIFVGLLTTDSASQQL